MSDILEGKTIAPEDFSYDDFVKNTTTLDPNGPNFVDSLLQDRERIRNSYNLPSRDDVANGTKTIEQYVNELNELSQKNGIEVLYDLDTYIQGNQALKESTQDVNAIDAAFEDENKEGRKIIHLKPNLDLSIVKNINTYEHELIHALQYIQKSNLPIEKKEYEAYLATMSKDGVKSESFRDMTFSMIKASAESYYKQNNQPIPWLKK